MDVQAPEAPRWFGLALHLTTPGSLWALERAYLEAWRTALPAAPVFREFVEHWTNDAFAAYVSELEAATNRVLEPAGDAEREAFRRVAQHERAFWQMAYATL